MPDRHEYQKEYRRNYKQQARRVNLTMSPSEHRSLSSAAKSGGETLSAYVKRIALLTHKQKTEAVLPEEILLGLAELDRVMRTVANNMNQLAYHSNRVRHVLDENQPFVHLQKLQQELLDALALCAKHSSPNDIS